MLPPPSLKKLRIFAERIMAIPMEYREESEMYTTAHDSNISETTIISLISSIIILTLIYLLKKYVLPWIKIKLAKLHLEMHQGEETSALPLVLRGEMPATTNTVVSWIWATAVLLIHIMYNSACLRRNLRGPPEQINI
ncbi:hypothetical protein RB195_022271 [Necator americanus]|uniref:Uncharacterized protein n=1 Tax=Necator americanus TaxID=51031 RepID=A0ABR1EEW2_NECAM